MKEIIKIGAGIYIGFNLAKAIDKGLNVSDKITGLVSKIRISKEK